MRVSEGKQIAAGHLRRIQQPRTVNASTIT
jgi:hypothetical protein